MSERVLNKPLSNYTAKPTIFLKKLLVNKLFENGLTDFSDSVRQQFLSSENL